MTTELHAAAVPAAQQLATLAAGATSGIAGRAVLVLLLLAAASAGWWVARRRAAQFRPVRPHTPPADRGAGTRMSSDELGAVLGSRATFVQFSAETCASCPQVRRVLTALAATENGVVHVEVSAEDRMDLVRRFSVFRTPTVLLLDPDGQVTARTSGPLTADRALAALAQLALPATRSTHA